MKTRILTAAVGIPLLFVLVLWAPLWIFAAALGLICAVAAYEFMRCIKTDLTWHDLIWPMSAAFVMPVWLALRGEGASLYTLGYFLFFGLFFNLILDFPQKKLIDFQLLLAGLCSGMVMPIMLSAIVHMGLRGDCGRYNMLLPFIIAFSCDSGAYFAGRFLGKRKLAPVLSPHKTVEGAIGGYAAGVAGTLLYGLVLRLCGVRVRFLLLLLYSALGCCSCELGDLSFSAVKRLSHVKDYGNFFPGHGGVLDRFDSIYFTAPLLEILTFWLPALSL